MDPGGIGVRETERMVLLSLYQECIHPGKQIFIFRQMTSLEFSHFPHFMT